MRYARNRLRPLGLSFLAALGLMAFTAVGAQGQSAGIWFDLVKPSEDQGEIHQATFTGTQEGQGSLLVPKLNMAIECEAADVEEGKLELGGVGHAQLKFLNCIVRSAALVTLGACKINEGKTITAKVKLLARLAEAHGNEVFVLAEALTGTSWASLKVENETGKFCSLSGEYSLSGTLALKILPGHEKVQLLIPYTNQALLGDAGLKVGENPATLDASATAELTGPLGLAGSLWGAESVQGQSAGIWSHSADGDPGRIHQATFTGTQEGQGSLLVPKLNMAIECEAADVEEGKLELGGVGHAQLKFLNCIVRSAALVTLGACKINEGKTITAKVKLLARLAEAHGNEVFVLAEALTGTSWASLKVENETGKFCSLSGEYSLSGTLALKILPGHEKVQLLIPYTNQALLGDAGLKVGENPATLDASATAELTGPLSLGGIPWGAEGVQGQSAGIWSHSATEATREIHSATFTGQQEGNGSLLVPGLNWAIECTAADVEEGKLELGGVGHLRLKFLNCITKTSALASFGACKIGNGKTITANFRLLARLAGAAHGNVPFVLAEPLTGTTWASLIIENETGKLCSIGGVYGLVGTFAFKVLAGDATPQLLIPYANQALLGDVFELGQHLGILDMSFTVELTGPPGLKGPFGVC